MATSIIQKNSATTLTNGELYNEAREYFKDYLKDLDFGDAFFQPDDLLYEGLENLGHFITFEKALALYKNNEDCCVYNETCQHALEALAEYWETKYTNFGYDENGDFIYYYDKLDLTTIMEAYDSTIGNALIDRIAEDYWTIIKPFVIHGYMMK